MSKPEENATDPAKAPKIPTVDLEKPIERGEQKITQLKFRKPEAGELRGLSLVDLTRLEVDTLITVLPRISMPPITDFEASSLCLADLLQCAGELADFFLTAADRAKLPA